MFLRTFGNYDTDEASLESAFEGGGKLMTVQDQKDECDINTIVRRFGLTGVMPGNVVPPNYEDFEDVFDFQSAMDAINKAQESFMSMPADIRSRFNNNPQMFLEFCSASQDGKLTNFDEMVKLGLAVSKTVPVEEVKS